MMKNILVIGGLDPSGCAGIAADLKTIMAWEAYGLPVLTTITAQNTQQVTGIYRVAEEVIRAQLEAVLSDIEVHAVKIGLLVDPGTVALVASFCKEFNFTNVVIDPVFRSTTGFSFADQLVVTAYKEKLFPLADVITPNIEEASVLVNRTVNDIASMKEAAVHLQELGARNVIITGGHLEINATDVFYDGVSHQIFETERISNTSARGLGCTFASIVAVHLAKGKSIPLAIESAKKYISRALADPLNIGKGRGPLKH